MKSIKLILASAMIVSAAAVYAQDSAATSIPPHGISINFDVGIGYPVKSVFARANIAGIYNRKFRTDQRTHYL